jgi:hypothetical protein
VGFKVQDSKFKVAGFITEGLAGGGLVRGNGCFLVFYGGCLKKCQQGRVLFAEF